VDAAAMADAFRQALRKPDFEDTWVRCPTAGQRHSFPG
jgi:hypothetical protein